MIRFELKNTNKLRDNTMVEVKMNKWFRYLGFLKIINRKTKNCIKITINAVLEPDKKANAKTNIVGIIFLIPFEVY